MSMGQLVAVPRPGRSSVLARDPQRYDHAV